MKHQLVPHRRGARVAVASVAAAALFALAGCASTGGGTTPTGGGEITPMKLRVATYAGESLGSAQASKEWTDLVTEKTDGAITFEWFYQGQLFDAVALREAVGNGAVDMGLFSHGYFNAEMPLSQSMNLGFLSTNVQAVGATHQWMWENNDAYRAEWDRNKIRPVFWGLEPASTVGCGFAIDDLGVLKGKNVRAASLITEDFTSVGSNVVALQATEILDAMERGVLDCYGAFGLSLATDTGVALISKHIYDYGRGGNGAQELIIGTDLWGSLPEAVQTAMNEATTEVTEAWYKPEGLQASSVMAACAKIKDAGGSVEVLSEDLSEEWAKVGGPANEKKFLSIAGADGPEFLKEYKAKVKEFEKEFPDYVDPTAACAATF